jgi:hypothetical protein
VQVPTSHLDCDTVNYAIYRVEALDIAGTKSWFEKISEKKFQTENYLEICSPEAYVPHGPKKSVKSRGLSRRLWLSRILGQAKAVVRP